MTTAVVTGAAGFIGSHLARFLAGSGVHVVAIDNFDPFYDRQLKARNIEDARTGGDVELIEQDIRDRAAMRRIMGKARPDVVFHLAALAGVRPSIREPDRFIDVNVNGTVSVLDATRECRCRTLVFASSSSVYGNNHKVPFAEDDPVDQPISPYAATKRAGELVCHTYAHLYGLRIACLRFFTVYGPGQRPDLAIMKFMRLMTARQPLPVFGDGSTSRDYTYIDDIIAGILAARTQIETGQFGCCRIWNLGNAHPVTLRSLIDRIASVTGEKPILDQQPMQAGDVERTWADLSRSQCELAYQPQISLDNGLLRQWQWVQAER